jgi:DNA recombination protein RmuC
MYYVIGGSRVSIEPVVAIGVFIAVITLITVNIVVLIRLTATRRTGVQTEAGSLDRITGNLGLLEKISGGVENLTRLFVVPHARGGLGESLLNELLRTWLPARAFELQYSFGNGMRADAVVHLGDFIVAIDSKFPLEQVRSILERAENRQLDSTVRRTFMKHIDDIATKYIQPSEGTLEFAIMYIPSEALYYRAFVEADGALMDEAVKRRVVPVGPSSLFLYLQTVSFGLQGLGLAENQRQAVELIRQLVRDFGDLSKSVDTTANHIRNAQKNVSDLANLARRFEIVLERLVSFGE